MGRTLLTGVFFCWLTLLGVAGIGKLTGLWSFPQFGSEPASLSECVDGMTTGLRREIASVGISAEQAGLHRARLDAATRPFCRAFIREPEATHLTKEDGPRLMREFLRQHPRLYEPICRVRLDADLVANAVIFRYLTATERRHLRDDMCRDQLAYLNAETGLIDYAGLIDERPDLYVLACGAVIQSELAQTSLDTQFGPASLRRISRRSCREALRLGAVDATGARALIDCRLDQNALIRIIGRVARAEARS